MACRLKSSSIGALKSLMLRSWRQAQNNNLSIYNRLSSKLPTFTDGKSQTSLHANLSPPQRPAASIHREPVKLFINNFSNKQVIPRPLVISSRQASRSTSKDNDEEDDDEKHLMDFTPRAIPNLWYAWKNFVITNLIIKPYLDKEFTISGFIEGAKQALVFVSQNLAEGNLEAVKHVLTDEAYAEVSRNLPKYSEKERERLRVRAEDIMYCFLYQMGIMMDQDQRWVEIFMVYHVGDIQTVQQEVLGREGLQGVELFREVSKKMSEKAVVCNYRFVREYTKGVEDDWKINLLNHFKPIIK